MSEEEVVAASTEAAAPAEGSKNNRNHRDRDRADETPIEDLYDLSQPIPRVSVVV
jgi:hypothetical protein